MTTMKRKTMVAGLGALAIVMALAPMATPAFAWTSSIYTCVGNYSSSTYPTTCTTNPSYIVGSTVYDTAKLTLTNDGSPFGSLTVLLAHGTCTSIGTTVSGVSNSNPSATGGSGGTGTTTSYYVASITTTSFASGSYVWLTSYSGTSSGYPYAPTSSTGTNPTLYNGNYVDCEPFTLQAPHGVPEFPYGMAIVMGLALPALFLMRNRRPMV